MLFFVDLGVDAKGRSLDELWDLWDKEVDAVHAVADSGMIVGLYKVAGQRRVVGVIDVPDHDALDRAVMAGMPMSDNLVVNEISPLREYSSFGADVKARWQS
jgi:muconolactone delta-isomerase